MRLVPFRRFPLWWLRHHLPPRESMSLDSRSPIGSLRIQFLCHPAGGGTTKLCETIISKVVEIIARVVVLCVEVFKGYLFCGGTMGDGHGVTFP